MGFYAFSDNIINSGEYPWGSSPVDLLSRIEDLVASENTQGLNEIFTSSSDVADIISNDETMNYVFGNNFTRGVLSEIDEVSIGLWSENGKYLVRNDVTKYQSLYTETEWSQSIYGIFISDDGQYFYETYPGLAYYSLSTPYDLRTRSQINGDFHTSGSIDTGSPIGVTFKPGGKVCYIGDYGSQVAHQITLSEPWELGTAVSTETVSTGLREQVWVSYDGTKMFQTNRGSTFYTWDLATPWDITTQSNQVLKGVSNTSNIYEYVFDWLGRTLYTADRSGNVDQYNLSIPWDIDSSTFIGTLAASSAYGLSISRNGNYLYESDDNTSVSAYEYQV